MGKSNPDISQSFTTKTAKTSGPSGPNLRHDVTFSIKKFSMNPRAACASPCNLHENRKHLPFTFHRSHGVCESDQGRRRIGLIKPVRRDFWRTSAPKRGTRFHDLSSRPPGLIFEKTRPQLASPERAPSPLLRPGVFDSSLGPFLHPLQPPEASAYISANKFLAYSSLTIFRLCY